MERARLLKEMWAVVERYNWLYVCHLVAIDSTLEQPCIDWRVVSCRMSHSNLQSIGSIVDIPWRTKSWERPKCSLLVEFDRSRTIGFWEADCREDCLERVSLPPWNYAVAMQQAERWPTCCCCYCSCPWCIVLSLQYRAISYTKRQTVAFYAVYITIIKLSLLLLCIAKR